MPDTQVTNQIPNLISLLILLPIVGAIIVMCLPRPRDLAPGEAPISHEDGAASDNEIDYSRQLVNGVSLFFAGMTFLLALLLFVGFKGDFLQTDALTGSIGHGLARNMQFVEDYRWIAVGSNWVHYKVGVDGISLMLVMLTVLLTTLSIVYATRTRIRLKEFMVFLLLLEAGLIGVFCSLDLVLFYVFFETVLIPMYFLIGVFGGPKRSPAALKFFIYTFAGSVFMLVSIVSVYQASGSFDLLALTDHSTVAGATLMQAAPRALALMFAGFAIAFAIKTPIFPFHTWLPDSYTESPTAATVMLGGMMSKMGTYGLLRFCLPLFPQQARDAAPIFIVLAVIGIVYGSLVAIIQPDAKRLIAYSSIAHLGIVVLGIFSFTRIGMMGALIQNISHAVSTPMLFFLVGMLQDRRGSTLIGDYGGLKRVTPMLATMLLIATLASLAVPFFSGFVGEFTVLLGAWTSRTVSLVGGYWVTAFAATTMILSAVYMLWWYQRLMLGPVTQEYNRALPDLTRREWAVLLPLAGLVFWIGIGSAFWTQRMDTSVNAMLPAEGGNNDLTVQLLEGGTAGASDQPVGAMLTKLYRSQGGEYAPRQLHRRQPQTIVPIRPGGPVGVQQDGMPGALGPNNAPTPNAGAGPPDTKKNFKTEPPPPAVIESIQPLHVDDPKTRATGAPASKPVQSGAPIDKPASADQNNIPKNGNGKPGESPVAPSTKLDTRPDSKSDKVILDPTGNSTEPAPADPANPGSATAPKQGKSPR